LPLEATTFAVIPFEYGVLEPGRDSLACAKCPRRAGIRGGGRTPRMSQRPELSSFSLAPNPASTPASAPAVPGPRQARARSAAPQRIPPWLERAELFLRVLLRMYIGLAICYVPWSRMFWDQNPLFVAVPHAWHLCGQRDGARPCVRVGAFESVDCVSRRFSPLGWVNG
jgi:hypothetical protein